MVLTQSLALCQEGQPDCGNASHMPWVLLLSVYVCIEPLSVLQWCQVPQQLKYQGKLGGCAALYTAALHV